MKKSIIGYISLIMIISFVVIVSGCTTTNNPPVKNKTFSKDNLTFEYPGSWLDNKTFNFAQTPSTDWEILGTIGDDNISLAVVKLNSTGLLQYYTIEEIARLDYSDPSGGVSLLTFNESNYNNITFYEIIYTSKDAISNDTYKNYKLIFGKEKKRLYEMVFKTKEADFEKNYQLMRQIQMTIQI